MFNNDDDNRDYTSRDEYGGTADREQVNDSRQSVWSSDEYGLPVKEEKQDDYAPAYVDNTYTNSFGNSLAGALAGMDKKESPEKKTDAKPHAEEKKYLGTSSFGFTKPAGNVSKDTHVFNKPKENRPDSSYNSASRFGGFNTAKRDENTAFAPEENKSVWSRPVEPQPEQKPAYSAPEENKPVWSQPVEPKSSYADSDGGYVQNGYGQNGYSQPEPKPVYTQPIESKPVWSQPVEQNSYNQPQNGYSQDGYSQNGGYDGGYAQPQQRGYYDGYAQGGYAQQGYSHNPYDNGYGYAQDTYGANASDSAPVQRPLTKEEIKRQQKHDALLQKEQDRQQKEQAKLDKLNLKEQERRQKAADKQAEFEEKERQRQEAAALKKQQAEEALALRQQKEQEALALKQKRMQEAEDKKLADKQAKEDKKRQAQEQKEQAKQDKINKKEQAKLDKEQAKFDKQNKKEEARQAKLDKKQQAIADKQQAKLDRQYKKTKTSDDNGDGFADMTEYNEEKKRTPEETDMLGGDFVSAVYGASSASAQAAPVQTAKPKEEEPRIPRYVSSDRQTVLVTLPDKEHMTRKQRKIAKKASRFDEMDLRNYPMTVGKWLGTIIILLIPVINFLACVFWFFGVGNKSRTALIRCFFVISLILLVLFIAALGVGYYFLAQKAQAEVGAETVNEVLIYGVDYVYEALGSVIGEDKLLPIRNAIVKALGGQEIQSSSGDSTGGDQTGENVPPFA